MVLTRRNLRRRVSWGEGSDLGHCIVAFSTRLVWHHYNGGHFLLLEKLVGSFY